MTINMGKSVRKYICALILLGLNGAAMVLFHRYSAFFFPAYRQISKTWISWLARLASFSPIAVWDIAATLLIVLIIVSLIHLIHRHGQFAAWLSTVFLCFSVLVTATVCGWMLNHYAGPLAAELGYEIRLYSEEELYETCDYFLLQAAHYAPDIPRDADNHLKPNDFYSLAKMAGSAYTGLGQKYTVLQGTDLPVKKLSLIGEYLMYNGIIGIFMPLTGEAGVPASVPPAVMPFTMAHEAAHRLGIASEEEANFAAFLACVNSRETALLYSGYYEAFSYCFASLYRYNPELALILYNNHDELPGISLVKQDRLDTAAIYKTYESSLQDFSDKINDTYLKAFSQESGIRSYGEVTNDLIAWYIESRE